MCDWDAQKGWVLESRVEGFETSGKIDNYHYILFYGGHALSFAILFYLNQDLSRNIQVSKVSLS